MIVTSECGVLPYVNEFEWWFSSFLLKLGPFSEIRLLCSGSMYLCFIVQTSKNLPLLIMTKQYLVKNYMLLFFVNHFI
jgi:hypothetical protein